MLRRGCAKVCGLERSHRISNPWAGMESETMQMAMVRLSLSQPLTHKSVCATPKRVPCQANTRGVAVALNSTATTRRDETCPFFSPLPCTNMSSDLKAASTYSEESFEFIETPSAPAPEPESSKYGVRTTAVSGAINPNNCAVYCGGSS